METEHLEHGTVFHGKLNIRSTLRVFCTFLIKHCSINIFVIFFRITVSVTQCAAYPMNIHEYLFFYYLIFFIFLILLLLLFLLLLLLFLFLLLPPLPPPPPSSSDPLPLPPTWKPFWARPGPSQLSYPPVPPSPRP